MQTDVNVPNVPLIFDTIWLCIGDERIPFKLGGKPEQEDDDALADTQKLPAIPRPATQEDATSPADTSIWQKADPDVQGRLKQALEDGFTHGRWGSSVIPCDACLPNMGKTVKLGETWPSGAYFTPQHGNCGCEITLLKEGEA